MYKRSKLIYFRSSVDLANLTQHRRHELENRTQIFEEKCDRAINDIKDLKLKVGNKQCNKTWASPFLTNHNTNSTFVTFSRTYHWSNGVRPGFELTTSPLYLLHGSTLAFLVKFLHSFHFKFNHTDNITETIVYVIWQIYSCYTSSML